MAETPETTIADTRIESRLGDRLELDEALEQLTEEFRAPVLMRDVGGLDYAEIAETLGIPPGTVRSRIARGRKQLSTILGNQQLS